MIGGDEPNMVFMMVMTVPMLMKVVLIMTMRVMMMVTRVM